MIDTIIFDVGNVLAIADWELAFRKINIPGEVIPRVIKATVYNPYWHEYDRGVMPVEEIIDGCIAADPELEEYIRRVFDNPGVYTYVAPYADEWLRSLKEAGYRICILSNFPKVPWETQEANDFSFLRYADVIVVSYRIKKVKPDRDIFEYLENTYGVVPGESVFLDDTEINIEAARSFGYNGIVFKDHTLAKEELCALLSQR